MTRLEWILGGVLTLLVLAIAALLLLSWLGPRSAPALSPASAAMIQPTSTFKGQTAHSAFDAAQPVAIDWAADARMINAMATWPEGSDIEQGAATWTFTFYSAGQPGTALISVIDNDATLVSSSGQAEPSLAAVNRAEWQLDSRDAIQRLLAAGGQSFLEQQGQATLILNLSVKEQVEWEGVLFVNATGESFSRRLDAKNGEVIGEP